jgi:hypothetical protein
MGISLASCVTIDSARIMYFYFAGRWKCGMRESWIGMNGWNYGTSGVT